jgi:hypothetical protein
MIEDVFYYLRILYPGDDFHFSRTLGTDQRINFIEVISLLKCLTCSHEV